MAAFQVVRVDVHHVAEIVLGNVVEDVLRVVIHVPHLVTMDAIRHVRVLVLAFVIVDVPVAQMLAEVVVEQAVVVLAVDIVGMVAQMVA